MGSVAIYARFSSDKQSGASIDDQVHRARAHVAAQGVDPAGCIVYADHALSGATLARPGLQAMLAAVERGELDTIVCESVDRLSRDAHEALGMRKRLAYRGVTLECLDGTRIGGAGDKNGLLMFGLRSMLGEQYLVDLADKTRRGLEGLELGTQPEDLRTGIAAASVASRSIRSRPLSCGRSIAGMGMASRKRASLSG